MGDATQQWCAPYGMLVVRLSSGAPPMACVWRDIELLHTDQGWALARHVLINRWLHRGDGVWHTSHMRARPSQMPALAMHACCPDKDPKLR